MPRPAGEQADRSGRVVARRWFLQVLGGLGLVGRVFYSPANDLSRFVDLPSLQVAPDWTAKLLGRRAAFAYEPVLAVYPVNHVTVFVAPLDLGMGLLLGALAGLNLAVALRARREGRTCRLPGLAGLAGALPTLLAGTTCCVPTMVLALGAQFAIVLLAVSGWLFPLALAATAISLLRRADHRHQRHHAGGADQRPHSASFGKPVPGMRQLRIRVVLAATDVRRRL